MSDVDEFDVGGASAPSDKLDQLHAKLKEVIALTEATDQMEEDLKAAKALLHSLRTGTVPDLMAELQMDRVSFSGYDVSVDDFVSGSLPKDEAKRAAALKYLEEHDGGGLIKTDVKSSFGKSQHEKAKELAERIERAGFDVIVESGVHAQSLQAYARQRIRDGEDVDPEILGLFTGKVVKLKEAKKK